MTTSHSETLNEQLASRLCEWAKARKLAEPDIEMIIDLVAALRVADDTMRAAGFFASAVAEPKNLRFAWTSGQRPFDPEAALQQLKKAAGYVMWAVDTELYGENPDGQPQPEPPGRYYYQVSSNGVNVRIDSPVPLSMDEICRAALKRYIKSGIGFGPSLQVSNCDEGYVAKDTVHVPTYLQLAKAGLLGSEGRAS